MDIPPLARRRYNAHKASAAQRNIEFKLSLEEWWTWWNTDDRWSNRGRGSTQYVMARHGDTGAYELGNIKCITSRENVLEATVGRKHSGNNVGVHLTDRSNHPRNKGVMTPAGLFASSSLAADYYGITRAAMCYRLERHPDYWRVE